MYTDVGVVDREFKNGSNVAHYKIKNHLILDDSDNSVRYYTANEYDVIRDLVKKPVGVMKLDAGICAKVLMLGDGCEIYRNDKISVKICIRSNNEYTFYGLDFIILNPDKLRFSDRLVNYDSDALVDYTFGNDRLVRLVVPLIYLSHVAGDNSTRVREFNKILNCTKFDYMDSSGHWYTVIGLDKVKY